MSDLDTKRLAVRPSGVARDGTLVRELLRLRGGSVAHFELAPGKTSIAVAHRMVEEIWYFVGGRGEMWRKQGDREEVVAVDAGICVTIPVGTHFQFRSSGNEPLTFLAMTMPPWPGDDEAYEVAGKWEPTVGERNKQA
jgi:mannose-6-phosphate isomerase-like protein (cupin superfamily)